MHSSNCFGLAPLELARLFKNRSSDSILYALAVAYAVTLGRCARSALPSRSASRRAVVSLIRVTCEYTSRPDSSSWSAGDGRIFSFWETFEVRWGPIFEGAGGLNGVDGPWIEAERRRLGFGAREAGADGARRRGEAGPGAEEEGEGRTAAIGCSFCGGVLVDLGGGGFGVGRADS